MSDFAIVPYEHYQAACDKIREKTGLDEKIKSENLSTMIDLIDKGLDFSQITSTKKDVLNGKTFANSNGEFSTGTMPNRGAVSLTISTLNSAPTIPEGYHDGTGKALISDFEKAKLLPENIAEDTSILGVQGILKKVTNKSGTISLENGNIVIRDLGDFLTVERIFISSTEEKPSNEVLNVFSTENLNLTSGGTVLLSALCGEKAAYDGYDLIITSVSCTFDGEILTILKPSNYSFIPNSIYTILR